MCKLSRPTLLCKIQEMCDITDGGLHRTMTWWFLIVENGVTWWFDRSACLEARRKVETTGLIALTFLIFIFALAFGCFPVVCVLNVNLSHPALFVVCFLAPLFEILLSLLSCHVTYMFLFVCFSVALSGRQLAVSIRLLSRQFTDSQWLREAWSASLSWPDFKIDSLARTPCTDNIAKTGLSLYSFGSHVKPSFRSGF